jgi:hydroxypyruvate reductase
VIPRAVCEEAFRTAVAVCDPEVRVAGAVARLVPTDKAVLGIAIGKAALAMARGAGPVVKGIAVTPHLDGKPLPMGWTARDAGHPIPDERSVEAGRRASELVASAERDDVVLVLISGGASALVEQPTIPLAEYVARVQAAMASGEPIERLNALRRSMSNIKGGKLAVATGAAKVITLAISDVIGDDLRVIGSGPTIPDTDAARQVCDARGDVAEVILPMRLFAFGVSAELRSRGIVLPFHEEPMRGRVTDLERGIHWGEPTLTVPDDHGEGGRAQQLALELARRLRGTDRSAFVAGSDGIDGPPPHGRPAPAGAYVDATTWDAIGDEAATRAVERRDAGSALAAVGALVITGPTGINHADVAVVG